MTKLHHALRDRDGIIRYKAPSPCPDIPYCKRHPNRPHVDLRYGPLERTVVPTEQLVDQPEEVKS